MAEMARQVIVTSSNMDRLSQQLHFRAMNKMDIPIGSLQEKVFLALAFAGEAGELANKVKKLWRDGETPELIQDIRNEIADNLIYLDHILQAFQATKAGVVVDKLDELYNVRMPAWAAEDTDNGQA